MTSLCTPQQAPPAIHNNKTLQPEKIQVVLVISFFSVSISLRVCKEMPAKEGSMHTAPKWGPIAALEVMLPASTKPLGIGPFLGANAGGGRGARGRNGVVPRRRRRRRKRRRGQPRRGGGGCGGQRSLRRARLSRAALSLAEPSRVGLNWAQAVSRKAEQSRTEPACAEPS